MSNIGIVGYGAYVPRFRIKVEEIARVWGKNPEEIKDGLMVHEKSVPDVDEDTITISVEAAKNAILRAQVNPQDIGAVYIGSESHPYAVKPSGTIAVDALSISNNVMVADFEFACKAGTAAIQTCFGLVKSGEIKYGLAIGADTSQGRPGDPLEFTAAAGGAAFVIGADPLAKLEGTYSFTTDTADFWRREGEDYPTHAARFTGKPAYFKHVVTATNNFMQKMGIKPSDINYLVLHTPNGKFPAKAAKDLGFTPQQVQHSLIVKYIGNTYSGASPLGLCNVLDIAKPGERILMTSYGSGAGSDSFLWTVTDKILERRDLAPKTSHYIEKKQYIDYGTYVKLRRKLKN